MKDINKKLSWNIERIDTELSIPMRCQYVFKHINENIIIYY